MSDKGLFGGLHSAAHSGRWCGGPAAAVRFKQRPKLVSYIRATPHNRLIKGSV